jgi:hypothetical protein
MRGVLLLIGAFFGLLLVAAAVLTFASGMPSP